jgi:hypothetical protein
MGQINETPALNAIFNVTKTQGCNFAILFFIAGAKAIIDHVWKEEGTPGAPTSSSEPRITLTIRPDRHSSGF